MTISRSRFKHRDTILGKFTQQPNIGGKVLFYTDPPNFRGREVIYGQLLRIFFPFSLNFFAIQILHKIIIKAYKMSNIYIKNFLIEKKIILTKRLLYFFFLCVKIEIAVQQQTPPFPLPFMGPEEEGYNCLFYPGVYSKHPLFTLPFMQAEEAGYNYLFYPAIYNIHPLKKQRDIVLNFLMDVAVRNSFWKCTKAISYSNYHMKLQSNICAQQSKLFLIAGKTLLPNLLMGTYFLLLTHFFNQSP